MKTFVKEIVAALIYFFKKWFIKHSVYLNDLNTCYGAIYTNDGDSVGSAVMFGAEDNCYTDAVGSTKTKNNFGNDKQIKVVSTYYRGDEEAYGRMILQSKHKPFYIGKIRLIFENENGPQYFNKTIEHSSKSAYFDGINSCVQTFIGASLDPYQMQMNIVDINAFGGRRLIIDGNAFLKFKVAPKSTLVVLVYPEIQKKVSYFQYKKIQKQIESRNHYKIYTTPLLAITVLKNQFKKLKQNIKNLFIKIK